MKNKRNKFQLKQLKLKFVSFYIWEKTMLRLIMWDEHEFQFWCDYILESYDMILINFYENNGEYLIEFEKIYSKGF